MAIDRADFFNIATCTACNNWRGHFKDADLKPKVENGEFYYACPLCGEINKFKTAADFCDELLDKFDLVKTDTCLGCKAKKQCPNHKKDPPVAKSKAKIPATQEVKPLIATTVENKIDDVPVIVVEINPQRKSYFLDLPIIAESKPITVEAGDIIHNTLTMGEGITPTLTTEIERPAKSLMNVFKKK